MCFLPSLDSFYQYSLISRQTEQTIFPYVTHVHGDRVTSDLTSFLTLTKTWTSVAGIYMCYHMHYAGADLASNTSEDIIIISSYGNKK